MSRCNQISRILVLLSLTSVVQANTYQYVSVSCTYKKDVNSPSREVIWAFVPTQEELSRKWPSKLKVDKRWVVYSNIAPLTWFNIEKITNNAEGLDTYSVRKLDFTDPDNKDNIISIHPDQIEVGTGNPLHWTMDLVQSYYPPYPNARRGYVKYKFDPSNGGSAECTQLNKATLQKNIETNYYSKHFQDHQVIYKETKGEEPEYKFMQSRTFIYKVPATTPK